MNRLLKLKIMNVFGLWCFCHVSCDFKKMYPLLGHYYYLRQCIQPHACVFTIQPHACGCIRNPGHGFGYIYTATRLMTAQNKRCTAMLLGQDSKSKYSLME